jgi:hypothetical protein
VTLQTFPQKRCVEPDSTVARDCTVHTNTSGTSGRSGKVDSRRPGNTNREKAIASRLLALEELDTPLMVRAWDDAVLNEIGFDARSPYVERFWLGLLGPSATWLVRALAYGLEGSPIGFALPPRDFARVLGLGDRTGKSSPLVRAVTRLCHFEHTYFVGDTLHVRTSIPWLDRRQVVRLPTFLQAEHQLWDRADEEENPQRAIRRRAASTAKGLARIGSSEQQLTRALNQQGIHPALAQALAQWAWEQQQLLEYSGLSCGTQRA